MITRTKLYRHKKLLMSLTFLGSLIAGPVQDANSAPTMTPIAPVSPKADLHFTVFVKDSANKQVGGATCTLFRRKIEGNTETQLYMRVTSAPNDLGIGGKAEFTAGEWPAEDYTYIIRCGKDGKTGSYEFQSQEEWGWAESYQTDIVLE